MGRTIGIIGAGNMGRALATRLGGAGYDVTIADRGAGEAAAVAAGLNGVRADGLDAVLTADAVILAVWHHDALAIAGEHAAELAGKLVIDIANPLDETYTALSVAPTTSAAELLAEALPDAMVVKAFNTTPAALLVAGGLGGVGLDVHVASDHQDARAQVLSWVAEIGLRPIDAGALANARLLERLQAYGIELGMRYGLGFDFAFTFLPAGPLRPPGAA